MNEITIDSWKREEKKNYTQTYKRVRVHVPHRKYHPNFVLHHYHRSLYEVCEVIAFLFVCWTISFIQHTVYLSLSLLFFFLFLLKINCYANSGTGTIFHSIYLHSFLFLRYTRINFRQRLFLLSLLLFDIIKRYVNK